MKNIIVATDLSGVGRCSLGVSIPILSVMGHNVIPLTTGIFSCQTGFDGFHFAPNTQFVQFYEDIVRYQTPSALYVGFLTDKKQLEEMRFIAARKDKQCIKFVDPIMADNGRLYPLYDNNYVADMRLLVRESNCITPNLTEACLLCGVDYNELTALRTESGYLKEVGRVFGSICDMLQVESAVITGVVGKDFVGNVVYQNGKVNYITNDLVEGSFSGTGDIFASVVVGSILNGDSLLSAVQRASLFVYNSIAATAPDADVRKGTDFQRLLHTLI